VFSAYCIAAAFGTYFCMYAFRKPFTAATFEEDALLGVDYKTILIVSQLLGYTLSKFIGIRVVSEMSPRYRAVAILALIGIAHVALLIFAVVPAPYNFALMFLNGLPLGMVFGLVLGFLEGRRLTEMLTAGLCASFIVSSGVVKSVGQFLLQGNYVSDYSMPFAAGLVFVIPLLVSVWLLAQIPPPGALDVEARSAREPIGAAERWSLFRWQALGLSALVLVYTLLTILRSLRDDFGVEIWAQLGSKGVPGIFAQSETMVMFIVLLLNGSVFLVRDNRRAFLVSIMLVLGGFAGVLGSALAFQQGWLGGFAFMVTLGVGAYVPYVAFHTTVFERLIAVFRDRANLGYFMYLADSFGYLGYVFVLLLKNVLSAETDYLALMLNAAVGIALLSIALMLFATRYYFARFREHSLELAPERA
jgi:hypothetical protein